MRERERRESKGRETRCSPWVVWSRSCPINTGEQLDRPGPPSWLTAESSHWPPALCYMTWGVQLNWQRETACTSQSAGGRGLGESTHIHPYTLVCLKAAPRTMATKLQTQKYPLSHTPRQEESHTVSLHRWAEEGNTPVLQLLSGRKWGVVGLRGVECILCADWIFSTWRASGCFCQLHSWAARSQVVWPHDCPRGTAVREGEMGREREWKGRERQRERESEREKDRGPGTGLMQHAWWGVITNPIQSAVEFVNIHTLTFHCLSALWPKSSMLCVSVCMFFHTHTHTHRCFLPILPPTR